MALNYRELAAQLRQFGDTLDENEFVSRRGLNMLTDAARALDNGADLLVAAKVAQEVLQKRLPGLDQNPRGVMDLLGSAISKIER